MQTSSSKQPIGCIGKCTTGLSRDELDQITDNINKTLAHPRGREIFRKYLKRRDLEDSLECLNLYETCCYSIDEAKRCPHSLEPLVENAVMVREMVEDLEGVSELDLSLLQTFNEAIDRQSRPALFDVLVHTRDSCRNFLCCVHESFKKYASEPCPLSKK